MRQIPPNQPMSTGNRSMPWPEVQGLPRNDIFTLGVTLAHLGGSPHSNRARLNHLCNNQICAGDSRTRGIGHRPHERWRWFWVWQNLGLADKLANQGYSQNQHPVVVGCGCFHPFIRRKICQFGYAPFRTTYPHDPPARSDKESEPPPTRDVNRDSGTASASGGWPRREPA